MTILKTFHKIINLKKRHNNYLENNILSNQFLFYTFTHIRVIYYTSIIFNNMFRLNDKKTFITRYIINLHYLALVL